MTTRTIEGCQSKSDCNDCRLKDLKVGTQGCQALNDIKDLQVYTCEIHGYMAICDGDVTIWGPYHYSQVAFVYHTGKHTGIATYIDPVSTSKNIHHYDVFGNDKALSKGSRYALSVVVIITRLYDRASGGKFIPVTEPK